MKTKHKFQKGDFNIIQHLTGKVAKVLIENFELEYVKESFTKNEYHKRNNKNHTG